jgi:DNA replication protein DnaC
LWIKDIRQSNQPLSDWAAIFPDPATANAIMDRLPLSAHQIVMKGDSYRSKKPKIANAKT